MKYFLKKSKFAIIGAVFVLILSLAIPVLLDYVYEVDNMSFNAYDLEVHIEENGDMLVHETMIGKFDSGMKVVFKDIIYSKNQNNQPLNTASFDTSSVKVKVYNNTRIYIDSENNDYYGQSRVGYSWNNDLDERGDYVRCPSGYGSNCSSIFTYVPSGISPTMTYEFTYKIIGAVSTYKDIAELNWTFYEPLDSMKIKNVSVRINFPSSVTDVDDIYFYGHGAKNGKLDEITKEYVSFSYSRLYPSDVIEARILFPSSLISNPRLENYLDENKLEYFLKLESQIEKGDRRDYYLGRAIFIFFLLGLVFIALLIYKVYKKYDKEHKPAFYGEYYRELPASYGPAEMGYLYNFKDIGGAEMSATLLDLIRRNYIILDYQSESTLKKKADATLIVNQEKNRSELNPHEDHLIKWLIEDIGKEENRVTLDEIEKYAKAAKTAEKYIGSNEKWSNLAKKEARKYNFFDLESEKAFSKYSVLLYGLIALGVIGFFIGLNLGSSIAMFGSGLFIALNIITISYLKNIKRRSIEGNEDYHKWKAFRKFLVDFSHFEDYPLPSIVVWEHFLVYATAFGIADLVQKQLRLKYKDNLPQEYRVSPFNRYPYFPSYLFLRMNTTHRLATQTVARERSKAKGGGKGGKGGFGGGRSFGGGGGGFRGR